MWSVRNYIRNKFNVTDASTLEKPLLKTLMEDFNSRWVGSLRT